MNPWQRRYLELRDRQRARNRMLIGLAGALALHEILAGLVPVGGGKPHPAHPTVAIRVATERARPTPRPQPTPRPTARPTPAPRPRATPTPHIVRVVVPRPSARPARDARRKRAERAGDRRLRHGGAAARHAEATPQPRPVMPHPPPSFAVGRAHGAQSGGRGTGAGAGTDGGGAAGAGRHVGRGDAGDDLADTAPCGYVIFTHLQRLFRHGRVYEIVSLTLHLRNGETSSDVLHWPFVFDSLEDDPLFTRSGPMPMQFPPPGFDLEGLQSPATVIALHETKPNGRTRLRRCPGQSDGFP